MEYIQEEKIFEAKYVTILHSRDHKTIKIRWNGFVRNFQLQMVWDLIMKRISNHRIHTIIEDQSLLRISEPEIGSWLADSFIQVVEGDYFLKRPINNYTYKIMMVYLCLGLVSPQVNLQFYESDFELPVTFSK